MSTSRSLTYGEGCDEADDMSETTAVFEVRSGRVDPMGAVRGEAFLALPCERW